MPRSNPTDCFLKQHKSPGIEARKRCPPRTRWWAPSRQLAQVLVKHVLYPGTRCLSATVMNRVSTHIGGTVFTTQAVLPLTSASSSIAFRLDTDLPSVRWKAHLHPCGDSILRGFGVQAMRPAFSSPGFMPNDFPGPPSASQRAPAAEHVDGTTSETRRGRPRRRGDVPRPVPA